MVNDCPTGTEGMGERVAPDDGSRRDAGCNAGSRTDGDDRRATDSGMGGPPTPHGSRSELPFYTLLGNCNCNDARLRHGAWVPGYFLTEDDAVDAWARAVMSTTYWSVHLDGLHMLFDPGERPGPAILARSRATP